MVYADVLRQAVRNERLEVLRQLRAKVSRAQEAVKDVLASIDAMTDES